jgi:hypothetical protein
MYYYNKTDVGGFSTWHMQERRNAYIQSSGRKNEEKRPDGKL